jgi:hypothetical protein
MKRHQEMIVAGLPYSATGPMTLGEITNQLGGSGMP